MKLLLALCIFYSLSATAQSSGDTTFSTTLSTNLKISGVKCVGGETSGRSDTLCREGEWLVTIDQNICSPTYCTETFYPPVITSFSLEEVPAPEDIEYFSMKPQETVTKEEDLILRKHWVRFARYLEPEVLQKQK